MHRVRSGLLVIGLTATSLTGCGGGSVNTVPVTAPQALVVAVGNGPVETHLSHPSGYAVDFTFPATADGSTSPVAVSVSSTVPAGFTDPASVARHAESLVPETGHLLPPLFVSVVPKYRIVFSTTPTVTFTLPPSVMLDPTTAVYIAYIGQTVPQTWTTIVGPGLYNASAGTIGFIAVPQTYVMEAGQTYVFAPYGTSLVSAGGSTIVQPAAANLAGVGQFYQQPFTVVEKTPANAPILAPDPAYASTGGYSPQACSVGAFSIEAAQNSSPAGLAPNFSVAVNVYLLTPVTVPCTLHLIDTGTPSVTSHLALPVNLLYGAVSGGGN